MDHNYLILALHIIRMSQKGKERGLWNGELTYSHTMDLTKGEVDTRLVLPLVPLPAGLHWSQFFSLPVHSA